MNRHTNERLNRQTNAENKIIHLKSVDSTNLYLKKLAAAGAEDGTVVTADTQSAGHGRAGNPFSSEEGGLYFSYLMRTAGLSVEETVSVTTRTAVAVVDALYEACGIQAGIKWINDIILNSRKLAGILVEAGPFENGSIPYVVIGIGINVNRTEFPPELASVAVSVKQETGGDQSIPRVIDALVSALNEMREEYRCKSSGGTPAGGQDRGAGNNAGEKPTPRDCGGFMERYRRLCVTLGRDVVRERDGERCVCRAEDITDDGGLLVVYPDGSREVLRAGDTRVRGLEGYV